jgi:hypothetical protein
MRLYKDDCEAMDKYLESILNAYKDGEIDLATARLDLAHAMKAAAEDSEGEFKNYIRNPWKRD